MKRRTPSELEQCRNLGRTIRDRLQQIGVRTFADLCSAGSVSTYKQLCSRAGRRLPVCYYLYSLEGAIRGIHWGELPRSEKHRLRREVGIDRREL